MDDFKDIAHKTVAELFDMVKDQNAEIELLKAQLSLQRDRNKALEAELTSSRNYGDDLHQQLNNMEQCYIHVKKERDELQGKSRCIRNLVYQRNLAENMLRKISIAAQKKLPTFGAALRFNDEVKEILRGADD